MYVYRAMSSEELIDRINGTDKNKAIIKGENTFRYDKNKDYIHFYKFAEHAFRFQKKFRLAVVAKAKLNDDIIPPLEYGLYSDIDTYYDDSLTNYYIPLPEIIIDRRLFTNDSIIGFSNILNGLFEVEENGNYPLEFWVTRKQPFHDKEMQLWRSESIYYEYIKSLLPMFDYCTDKVAQYLKTIDLDSELNKMAKNIQKDKVITKRRFPRSSDLF